MYKRFFKLSQSNVVVGKVRPQSADLRHAPSGRATEYDVDVEARDGGGVLLHGATLMRRFRPHEIPIFINNVHCAE